MFTDLAMAAYALSMLGLKSANGTSTVIFTRVGLNCSTVLGTLVTSCCQGGRQTDGTAGMGSNEPRQSYGRAYARPTGVRRAGAIVGWWRAGPALTLDPRTSERGRRGA